MDGHPEQIFKLSPRRKLKQILSLEPIKSILHQKKNPLLNVILEFPQSGNNFAE